MLLTEISLEAAAVRCNEKPWSPQLASWIHQLTSNPGPSPMTLGKSQPRARGCAGRQNMVPRDSSFFLAGRRDSRDKGERKVERTWAPFQEGEGAAVHGAHASSSLGADGQLSLVSAQRVTHVAKGNRDQCPGLSACSTPELSPGALGRQSSLQQHRGHSVHRSGSPPVLIVSLLGHDL